MEERLRDAVGYITPVVEGIGAIVILVGVLVAFALWVAGELRVREMSTTDVRLRLGRSLALGLEFQLAADVLSTAVSPSFEEIGKLAAIATIRTLLNLFLAQELARERRDDAAAGAP